MRYGASGEFFLPPASPPSPAQRSGTIVSIPILSGPPLLRSDMIFGRHTVNKTDYVEYHICGDLTLSGSGYLTGSAPTTDVIVIIENGNLIVDDKSSINTARTAFVLTGDNNSSARMDFP